MRRVGIQRLLVGVGCVFAVVVLGTAHAAAFSLKPTDWSSSITSLVPANDAVSVEVIDGGDAMRLTAQPGHVVVIPGYRNEPYLRITKTGAVEANLRSPTWWANLTATGTGDSPPDVDPSAEPEWSVIAANSSVIWHDHRIHAMPGVTADTDWTVLVTVDDLPLVVRGRLTKLPSPSVLPAIIVGLLSAGVVFGFGLRRAWPTTIAATLLGSALAVLVAIGGWTVTPAGFDPPSMSLLAALLALVFAISCILLRNSARRLRVVLAIACLAALAWWSALMFPALTAAFIPNAFAAQFVRVVIAVVSGVVVGGAILVVLTGGFSDTETGTQADAAELGKLAG